MATTKSAPAKAPAKSSTSANALKSKAENAGKPALKTAPKAVVGKPAAPRSRVPAPEVKPAPVVVPPISILAPTPAPVAADKPAGGKDKDKAADGPMLKKPELVDRVVAESGAKKKDVKLIVEAMLKVLGDALSKGEELNLPPLGKAKVNRQRADKSGEMIMVKLKRGGKAEGGKGAKEALAEQDEDD